MGSESPTSGAATATQALQDVSFSIVTVTHNAAAHIAGCLESVNGQTYAHVEHVIVDGASTDDTAGVVQRLGKRVTHFHSERDNGIYDAMNKGVAAATGRYILFLGADDRLVDDRVLADAAAYLQREGQPHLVYGDLEVRELNGTRTIFSPPPVPDALDFLIYGCLPHQSTFARRDLFDTIGLFDTRYRVHGDYDWMLRVITTPNVDVRYMQRVVGSFLSGGTSSQLEKGQEELFRIQNALPLYQEPEWMMRRLLKFQQTTLAYRMQLNALSYNSPVGLALSLAKKLPRYIVNRARGLWPQ